MEKNTIKNEILKILADPEHEIGLSTKGLVVKINAAKGIPIKQTSIEAIAHGLFNLGKLGKRHDFKPQLYFLLKPTNR